MANAFQQAIDNITARVGDWLTVPTRIRALYDRVQDPTLRDQIATVDASYQGTRNLVQQGLDVAQRAKLTNTLPSLSQVPLLVSAAAALIDVTTNTRKLEQAAAGIPGSGITAPRGSSALVWGAAAVGTGGLLWMLFRRRRRRRSR